MAKKTDEFANSDVLDIGFSKNTKVRRSNPYSLNVPVVQDVVNDFKRRYPGNLDYPVRVPASLGYYLDGADTSKFEDLLEIIVSHSLDFQVHRGFDVIDDFLSVSLRQVGKPKNDLGDPISRIVALLNANGYLDKVVEGRFQVFRNEFNQALDVKDQEIKALTSLKGDLSDMRSRYSALAYANSKLQDAVSSLQSKLDASSGNYESFRASYFHIPKLRVIRSFFHSKLVKLKNYTLRPFRLIKGRF